jgi:hypothetical protein
MPMNQPPDRRRRPPSEEEEEETEDTPTTLVLQPPAHITGPKHVPDGTHGEGNVPWYGRVFADATRAGIKEGASSLIRNVDDIPLEQLFAPKKKKKDKKKR